MNLLDLVFNIPCPGTYFQSVLVQHTFFFFFAKPEVHPFLKQESFENEGHSLLSLNLCMLCSFLHLG